MNDSLLIKKILNNNALIVTDNSQKESVVIGKGIGFGKKTGDLIQTSSADKWFVLKDEKEQEHYKQLLHSVDEKIIDVMNDVITHIQKRSGSDLDEHIHIALTDHIGFAIKRLEQGLDIKNPFLVETQTMYPMEYTIAEEAVEMINKHLSIHLPEGEIGFVALHIHSAITKRTIHLINRNSSLVAKLISLVSSGLDIEIDPKSINYLRLVRHLRHAIERIEQGEIVENQDKLANVLKEEYPLCYNLAWKLIKVMQNDLQKPVPNAEAVYLTMHLQRLSRK
ncbi:glucose PTS transporter transcription antiterminator GlcT [Fictibacillus aquaticus]|uniref:PtsGHI operon antiterminator n=1 Tax=Fictibacillus aquaticus TaxID=2021314 RepID=A0A235F9V6_9BACL|nr:PRD domain-containing protein [Fictibacillus aquaticus]OYD58111.1 PtsGHI operon antiterminator [Fictibacillus aquaticus]